MADIQTADKWEMVALAREAIEDGLTLDEIARGLGISRKRCNALIHILSKHGRDFGYIWDSFVAHSDLAVKQLSGLYEEAKKGEVGRTRAEELTIMRGAIADRVANKRNLVELAIGVGYLQVEKERARNAGEARLGKLAEAVMVKLMQHKRAIDVRSAEERALGADDDADVIEIEATNGHANGSGNGHANGHSVIDEDGTEDDGGNGTEN